MAPPQISLSETSSPASDSNLINSLRRGLGILEVLAAEPEGLLAKTVSFRTGLNLSTCYHLLNTLVAAGYAIKLPDTQRYMLSGKAIFPQFSAAEHARIVPWLQPHMYALRDATRETAYLSLRGDGQIVIGAIVDSPQALKVSLLYVGYDGAAHAMALGKAILAYMDDRDATLYLQKHGMPSLTANTYTEPPALKHDLAMVRQRGYSLDLEEFAPGVCCIGAPVFGATGRVAASLAISLPASRYHADSAKLIDQVVVAAGSASHSLAMLSHAAPLATNPRAT